MSGGGGGGGGGGEGGNLPIVSMYNYVHYHYTLFARSFYLLCRLRSLGSKLELYCHGYIANKFGSSPGGGGGGGVISPLPPPPSVVPTNHAGQVFGEPMCRCGS